MTEPMETSVPVVVLAPGFHGHGIARSLGRLGVPVYGVHADPRSPAARSRYWRENFFYDLTAQPPGESLEWLMALGRRLGAPILIPTDDASCLFVADHAAVLRDVYQFPDQPPGLARSLSNKQQMYLLCKKFSIPTPETVFPRCRDDVAEFAEDAAFPVMLKGIDTLALRESSGVKMLIVEDGPTLLKRYEEMENSDAPNLMLQEYIPGGSDAVWMFNGYFDGNSDCLFGITGRKLRQYPPYTGVTSLGVCIPNERVAAQTREFMKVLGYRGILDIGYKYDARRDEYRLLDVNPRVGSSFRLFVDSANTDVVRMLYGDLTGQRAVRGTAVDGRKWVVENFDAASSITYLRDGRFTGGAFLQSFRGVREASWFALDDLSPFFAVWWSSLRRVLGKRESKDPPISQPLRDNRDNLASSGQVPVG